MARYFVAMMLLVAVAGSIQCRNIKDNPVHVFEVTMPVPVNAESIKKTQKRILMHVVGFLLLLFLHVFTSNIILGMLWENGIYCVF